MSVLSRTTVALLLFAPLAAVAVEPEERILRDANLPIDGPALLAYLKSQIPSATDRARLSSAVGQLGHRSFVVRERATRLLATAGRPALTLVRAVLADGDLEVSRRAERIVAEIERISQPSLMTAVVRVLAHRKPVGVVDVYLGYLPYVEDESVEEAVREGLATTGLERNSIHPAIRAALTDREARARAAAVYVLGRNTPPPVKELLPLLKDAAPEVRLLTAEAVLRGRDRAGVPVLLALLEEAPLLLGRRAEDLLFHLGGDTSPNASLGVGDEAARRRCRETWTTWWTARGDKIDLARFQGVAASLGVTLVVVYDGVAGEGQVFLEGPDGKQRWTVGQLGGPNDAQLLPGGRILVAERNTARVTERDTSGRVLWEKRVEAGAISAVRLPGGNTLIATWNSMLETSPDGKVVWSHSHPGGFRQCCRGPNGRLWAVTAGGQVLEFDRTGKVLRTITPERHGPGAGYWASLEVLPGGRFLLALGSARRVIEMDETGKIYWEAEVPNVVFATRLSNGNTQVCNFEEALLVELDRTGKELTRRKLPGRPFAVRKY